MKIMNLLPVVLVTAALSACDFADHAMPPYDGELDWTLVEKDPGFSERQDHALVSFNGKLWVIGGYDTTTYNGDSFKEDVWSSVDGKNWTLILDNAPWNGRQGHSVVAFGGKFFLLGGFVVNEETGNREYANDVWSSTDGESWVLETGDAGWSPRFEHSVVQANHGGTDYLYLIGGFNLRVGYSAKDAPVYYNDVWRSTDGVNWIQLTTSADIGGRHSTGAAVDPSTDRIYIFSGLYSVREDTAANWDKLWYTDDGIDWNYTSQESNQRANHQMVFHDNRMWLLPGRNQSDESLRYTNPKQYSTYFFDGSWYKDSDSSGVGARFGYGAIAHDGKIWVIGGRNADNGPDNDVWMGEIK